MSDSKGLERLEPELKDLYAALPNNEFNSIEDVRNVRQAMTALDAVPPAAGVTKHSFDEDGVRGLFYQPEVPAAGEGPKPAIFWIHGGGMIGGRPSLFQDFLCRLCLDLGLMVFAPQYRLAPEDPFPAGLDDVTAAWKWFATKGVAKWQLDPSKLAVGGASAGAGLALSLALANRDTNGPSIAALILDIPYVSHRKDWSMTNIIQSKIWSEAATEFSAASYTPPGTRDDHKYAWPIEHPSFHGLPVAQVTCAELDVLRDAGIEVATRMMRESSNGVELHVWKGVVHGSHGYLPDAPISRVHVGIIVTFLSRELGVPVRKEQK